MKTTFTTQGTCARFIDIDVEDGVVLEVRFIGGCSGNAQGIASLVRGLPVETVISRLRGIICRGSTSCPDQLSRALQNLSERQAI